MKKHHLLRCNQATMITMSFIFYHQTFFRSGSTCIVHQLGDQVVWLSGSSPFTPAGFEAFFLVKNPSRIGLKCIENLLGHLTMEDQRHIFTWESIFDGLGLSCQWKVRESQQAASVSRCAIDRHTVLKAVPANFPEANQNIPSILLWPFSKLSRFNMLVQHTFLPSIMIMSICPSWFNWPCCSSVFLTSVMQQVGCLSGHISGSLADEFKTWAHGDEE